eukprot:GHVU01226676.1.p1 GENE.GHVU01226676.1~~GHVU01226676.1.p1  ORF type:complete len:186 (+),score=27.39 GHVU01226676.1:59-616(+)
MLESMKGASDGPFRFPFMLLRRENNDEVLHIKGSRSVALKELNDLSMTNTSPPEGRTLDGVKYDVVAAVPYSQIREKAGHVACAGDEKLSAIVVQTVTKSSVSEFLQTAARDAPCPQLRVQCFLRSAQDTYAATVEEVVTKEIHKGEGSSFVIQRTAYGTIENCDVGCALEIFRRFLLTEFGAYC